METSHENVVAAPAAQERSDSLFFHNTTGNQTTDEKDPPIKHRPLRRSVNRALGGMAMGSFGGGGGADDGRVKRRFVMTAALRMPAAEEKNKLPESCQGIAPK